MKREEKGECGMFPSKHLDMDYLKEILHGGTRRLRPGPLNVLGGIPTIGN